MTTSRRIAIVENKDREGLALPIGETPEGAIDWEFIEAMTAVSGPFTRRVVEMNAAPTDAEIEAMAEKLWDTYRGAKPSSLWIYVDWRDLSMREPHTTSGKQCIAFRAMARVALSEVRG